MNTSIYQQHRPEGASDGLYLKLKDGDNFKLRILSEPVITVYKEGDRPRYAWVVWNHDLKKTQIYAAGVSVYSQLVALVEDWGEPTDFDVRIKREGSGIQDTSYLVTPVKNSTAPPDTAFTEAEKIDLPQATKGKWLKDFVDDHTLPEPFKVDDEEAPELTEADVPDFLKPDDK